MPVVEHECRTWTAAGSIETTNKSWKESNRELVGSTFAQNEGLSWLVCGTERLRLHTFGQPAVLSRFWHKRRLRRPCARYRPAHQVLGDGWGWASRLTVLEGLSNDAGMLVWTSFLAAPFGEVIPRPTLLGRALWKNFHGPSMIESAERPDARPRTAEDE